MILVIRSDDGPSTNGLFEKGVTRRVLGTTGFPTRTSYERKGKNMVVIEPWSCLSNLVPSTAHMCDENAHFTRKGVIG